MKKKIAIFAFNGELMYFTHALLNALELHKRGHDVKLILEGDACGLLHSLRNTESPFSGLFQKVKKKDIIDGACRACCVKMKTDGEAEQDHITLSGDMSGHASITSYIEQGYEIITM